ncbi:unnamed protein product [Macrosiphum euphorbiae]|nr:unnamed protein product [Macrosiphum euphorbiae]
MKMNKIQKDDLQPLKELTSRVASTLKKISNLETRRHRAAVTARLVNSDLMENRRLLMHLRNYSPVSTSTETFVEKKPCRVRYIVLRSYGYNHRPINYKASHTTLPWLIQTTNVTERENITYEHMR